MSADTGYGSASKDGFFYYKDPKEIKKKEKPKSKEKPKTPAAPAPEPKKEEAPAQALPKKKALSVEWLNEMLPVYLNRAIDDPSDKNVLIYKYLERMAIDKASNFTKKSQEVIEKNPMLNEAVRFPIATAARSQALFQIERAKKAIFADISKKAGLWMFFNSRCAFCHSQYATMQNLQKHHPNLVIEYITTDGGIIQGMQGNFRNDKGGHKARSLGIQLTPAVVMVVPSKNTLAIVAHGAMSMDELEHKIVTAAIDMGIADSNLTNLATLQDRGIVKPEDIKKIQDEYENIGDDPDKLIRLIEKSIGKNMY